MHYVRLSSAAASPGFLLQCIWRAPDWRFTGVEPRMWEPLQ